MRISTAVPSLIAVLASLPFTHSQDSVVYDSDDYGADGSESPYQSYMSNPNVNPPEMLINRNESGLQSGYVFLGIDGTPDSGQEWPAIFEFSEDGMGSLIWTGNYTKAFDFRAQTYQGEPVLTFWTGELLTGWGHGSFHILNQSYVEIADVSVVGFGDDMGDIHEFVITDNDTALVAIYHEVPWNLTAVGGPEDGWLMDNSFQEIDIATGELLFQWNATTHVDLEESYDERGDNGRDIDTAWDYFHINSIEKDGNGDYIISARVMHCIFKVSGEDGRILWRMNGKRSDFEMEDDARFEYQHDARWINEDYTRMTLFDNGASEPSRGLLLDVDQDSMTVRLIQEFIDDAGSFGPYEGSFQAIDPSNETTNFLLGLGSEPKFAELDYEGNVLLEVRFAATQDTNSYRAYHYEWEGKPLTKPDIYWSGNDSAYVSWLGATGIRNWEIYSANSSDSRTWTNISSVRRVGFETVVDLSEATLEGDFLRARAVDSDGETMGWTRASDGDQLYDAPDDDIEISGSESDNTPSTTTGSTPQNTSGESDSEEEENNAAVRATRGVIEKVYLAALLAVGGFILI